MNKTHETPAHDIEAPGITPVYKKAHIWQIGFFSLNTCATNLYLAMMAYVSYYANGIAGISVIMISMLLTVMRVFNGITDPIVGYIIDKTHGRFGKFRPFMLIGNTLLAISCILLYFTTHHMPVFLRIPYFILVYGLFIVAFTFQTAVTKSAQSIITNDPKQRPICTFFDSTFISAAYGGVALYVSERLIPCYGSFNNPKLFAEFIIVTVTLSMLCTLLAIVGIWSKDKDENFVLPQGPEHENAVTIHAYLDVLRHNRPIQMLVIAASTDKFASVVYSHAAVTVMMYGIIMNNYSIYGLIGIITAVPSLLIVVFGISLARHFGQRKVLILFTWASIIFQTIIGLLLLSDNISTVSLKHVNFITILFFTVFAILNGCKSITNNMVIPMIADCTDYELYRSGRFVPGLMGALFSFVDNFVSSLGTAFVGIMLSIIGFGNSFPQVGDAMTPLILWSTIFFYCVTPIIGWIISLISMQYYRLDKKSMEDIVLTLNKTRK